MTAPFNILSFLSLIIPFSVIFILPQANIIALVGKIIRLGSQLWEQDTYKAARFRKRPCGCKTFCLSINFTIRSILLHHLPIQTSRYIKY